MLDGTYFFECRCGADEHTLRFILDKQENEIYTSVFLNQYHHWYERIWLAIKYIFNYKCKCGHFDCFILNSEDAEKLQAMLNEFNEIENEQNT